MTATLDISFDTFSQAAEAAGYKPVQYSKTGYFVKTADGIRCEFQTTRGGVNSVGYGSSSKVVDALEKLLLTPDAEGKVLSPLPLIKRITGSINFSYVSLDKFFELVTATEQLRLEKSGAQKAVRKATEAKAPAAPKAAKVAKAVTKEITDKSGAQNGGNALSPSGSATHDEAVAAIDARLSAKASGATKTEADEAAIKAANLARLKAVGAKLQAQKVTLPEPIETLENAPLDETEYDGLPEFPKSEFTDPRAQAE